MAQTHALASTCTKVTGSCVCSLRTSLPRYATEKHTTAGRERITISAAAPRMDPPQEFLDLMTVLESLAEPWLG